MPSNIEGKLNSGKIAVGDTVTIKVVIPSGGGTGAVTVIILGNN